MATPTVAGLDEQRRVVLLTGEPASGASSGFHRAARSFHLDQPADRRPVLARTVTSFAEVREALLDDARGDRPWGEVILVAHGSQWLGLALPLFDAASAPARASEIEHAIARGEFPALPDAVVDARTTVVLESCGVGRRPDLLALYARLLGGDDTQRPQVRSSTGLVEFSASGTSQAGGAVERRELPYLALVVAGEPDPVGDQAHRARLQAQQPHDGDWGFPWRSWQVMPVRLSHRIEGDVPLGMRQRPLRFAQRPEVALALADFGLDARRLAWALECDRAGSCTVQASGRILSLSPGELPELVPFSP
jgi:hypothetical protein